MRIESFLIAALALSSCAAPIETDRPAEWRSKMRVYRASETPRGARIMRQINATSCKSTPWGPEPTDEDAIRKLQVDARGMGGDAVGDLTCGIGSAIESKCLSSIVCHGTAIRVNE